MFGIDGLKEEIALLRDSVDELKEKLQTYIDEEVTFSEMTDRLDASLKEFQESIMNDFEERFRSDDIVKKLLEIIKKLPEPVNEVKAKPKAKKKAV